MSTNISYEQLRTVHDENRNNHYDRLQRKMQKERTKINSAPTITKYEDRGNINHEPPIKSVRPVNYHTITLNHCSITKNNI